MLWLLYFGRLEKEKWFDAIIDMIELFDKEINSNEELPFELFVFGTGSREAKIKELAGKYKNIHFFWRQSLETIKRYIPNCNYCLIPSECLETFGLSALTAIKLWLPVIGYAKWWLKEFIDTTLDLTHQAWTTTSQKLYNLIDSLSNKPPIPNSQSSVPEWYTKASRIVRFHSLARKEVKKVMIVSDFINRIGGIETYINDVKELLEPHGYEVILCGWTLPSWPIGKIAKYMWIVTGLGNFREAIKLRRKIRKMKPDLIRYHSVMRYLGRAPIWVSKWSAAKKRMMFHDLGYFYPFPSQLTDEHQIKTPLNLKHFLASSPTKNPVKRFAMMGKYIVLALIKNQLHKRMDSILVPSEFMIDIAHKSYQIDKNKIISFPHFIQE